MENSSGSMADYSSEFAPMKKMKREYSSENDCKVIEIEESEDIWIKPKSEKKDGMETAKNNFCGRLNVITAVHSPSRHHLSDGAASSSEMSPGGSSPSRSCTQCGATKTPLWRNGPCGPKSLCNACGIRYKKVGSSTKRNNNNNTSDSHDQPKPSTLKSPKRKADTSDVIERERSHNHIIHNRRSKREIVEHKVSQMVFRQSTSRVSVPRRVCTRKSIPAFHSTPKWGSRSARFNSTFRKSQSKDEEEEGAALLMALACGLVNA